MLTTKIFLLYWGGGGGGGWGGGGTLKESLLCFDKFEMHMMQGKYLCMKYFVWLSCQYVFYMSVPFCVIIMYA